ncbi:MAG: hypothetical protein U9N07_01450, partial [Euryarchaeota archaeon]|nr:hypothetical protein [Euryarchaeota archaeon]
MRVKRYQKYISKALILVAASVMLFCASASADDGTCIIYTDMIEYACFVPCMVYLVYSIRKHAVGGANAWSIILLAVVLFILSAFGDFAENFVMESMMDTIEDVCLMAGMVAFAAGLRNLARTV